MDIRKANDYINFQNNSIKAGSPAVNNNNPFKPAICPVIQSVIRTYKSRKCSISGMFAYFVGLDTDYCERKS